MSSIIYERITQEAELVHRWWKLPPQTVLLLADGQRCLLIYPGEPGGSAGPDVRDAVLRFLPPVSSHMSTTLASAYQEGLFEQELLDCQSEVELIQAGDVEFHVRASDWFVHEHHTDPRYNRVALHVVFYLDSTRPTLRQDGSEVPTCSLLDTPQMPDFVSSAWPCQREPLTGQVLTSTLLYAGLLRFHGKSYALKRALAEASLPAGSVFTRYDAILLPELAEALGYGRDRAFFRAVGQQLAGLPVSVPEPLGRALTPSPLDEHRLRLLMALQARWRKTGVWSALLSSWRQDLDVKDSLAALRAVFRPLSRARTDIMICNVVLPFAAAVANLEQDTRQAARALQLYLAYPGLVSNRVTRMMSAQLQLSGEPAQACLQQGLHHIYVRTCQAKQCQACLCGGQRL